MKVLIACEESQTVCKAFRKLGVEAYSNDIQECSGGHPEWHLQMDARKALANDYWDLVIAHPPCTRLANSGVMWLDKRNLWGDLKEAAAFFNVFTNYGKHVAGARIVIENPIPHKYALQNIGKYTQIIQPYEFGHMERKATCLWNFNMPNLMPTNNVKTEMMLLPKKEQQRIHFLPPSKDRAKLRSKTFQGIADAMAEQYTKHLLQL